MKPSAQDKTAGNAKRATIKSGKGRLSQVDIGCRATNAENSKSRMRKPGTSKRGMRLGGNCLGARDSIRGELADKVEAADKAQANKAANDTLAWIEAN
jgi:hypothetical protein